jgi:hypothetical protein
MKEKEIWDKYKGKKVRLIVIDGYEVRPRDGIFLDYNETHVFLEIDGKTLPVSFLRSSIKRIEPGE